ncbi:MAG: hypothetical protein O3A75_02850 [Verrucomicrobia bacterium]|nr:hypothetical protein [Verrucomicrobiota bacterium]
MGPDWVDIARGGGDAGPRRFRLYVGSGMVQGDGMKKALFLFLGMALCGCATTRVPQLEQPGYMKVLAAKKVAPVTYARIAHGRVLGYDDIRNLATQGIPGKMIVPYLKATKTPYDFSSQQINGLVDAGADSTLVNYLGKAKGIYLEDAGNIPSSTAGLHPYWSDPGYAGMAPFGFGYPDAWAGDFIGLY